MSANTIDQAAVVSAFRDFISINSAFQILLVHGDAKTGKTHLLTKVLPAIARSEGLPVAVVDVRSADQTILRTLDSIIGRLGREYFRACAQAIDDALTILKPQVVVKNSLQLLSRANISLAPSDDPAARSLALGRSFIRDLESNSTAVVVLFMDAVEGANATIHRWIMEELLSLGLQCKKTRVVIGYRGSPQLPSDVDPHTTRIGLGTVLDVSSYVDYCRAEKLDIEDSKIETLAQASGFITGSFIEILDCWLRSNRVLKVDI